MTGLRDMARMMAREDGNGLSQKENLSGREETTDRRDIVAHEAAGSLPFLECV